MCNFVGTPCVRKEGGTHTSGLGKLKAFDGLKLVSSVTNLELLIEMKWSELLLKCVLLKLIK